ncbi:MAG: hypothetical protein AAGJ18_09635 [Bacteroidota bacterium]
MNLKQLLLKKFLPFFLLFMVLSIGSMNGDFQKAVYPFFSNFSTTILNNRLTDTYFKAKPKNAQTDFEYNKISVLFQSKRVLSAETRAAQQAKRQPRYKYKGFNVTIDETFVAPLIFFICLLIFTPGSWKNKGIALVIGSIFILGFAYLIVYVKGLYMVSKSGVRDLAYSSNDINFFQLLHFFFSSVTIVTVVLITWIAVAFRKSDLRKLFEY